MAAVLGLGTVQFGQRYGIANSGVELSDAEVSDILASARANDIGLLDTAAQYGSSEERLGKQKVNGFRVITKSAPVYSRSSSNAFKTVINGACDSARRINVSQLDGLLVHNANDLLGASGHDIYRALRELKENHFVTKIGVSVYDEDQIDAIVQKFKIDIVQLPINVLDQRLARSGCIARLAAGGIEVHARSVYLQGLLLMRPEAIPQHLARHGAVRRWHEAVVKSGMTSMDAALAYVRGVPGIDVVLVGAVSAKQLEATASSFARSICFSAQELATDDLRLIDPRCWRY